jgi:hypothetical protein
MGKMITEKEIGALDGRIKGLETYVQSSKDADVPSLWSTFITGWNEFKNEAPNLSESQLTDYFYNFQTIVTNWKTKLTGSPEVDKPISGAGMLPLLGIAGVLLFLGMKK